MNSFLKGHRHLLLGASAIFLLILLRMRWTHTLHFSFLGWNIFLAVLPLLFSHLAIKARSKWSAAAWAGLWLLFFPNAAYLLTDLVHLQMRHTSLFWLDLAILFSAGVYGVLLGLISLRRMEALYTPLLRKGYVPLVSFALLMLCGYGMYLGRVERWNSWDLFTQPFALLRDVLYDVRHPFRSREAWGMTALFGSILSLFHLAGRRIGFRTPLSRH